MTDPLFHPSDDALVAFLLDELDDPARDDIDDHLDACEACLRDHAAAAETLASLALAAPPVAPPAALRDRVLAVTRSTWPARKQPSAVRRRWRVARPGVRTLLPLGLVAAIVAAVIVIGHQGPPPGDIATFSNAAGTLQVDHGTARLQAFALPPAPTGHSYQLWLLRPGRAPQPAALVPPGAHPEIAGVRAGDEVAVTVEPAGGSPVPTGAPVAVAEIA